MVQEELARHEKEGEVMERPPHEQETTDGIVFDNSGCTYENKIASK